MKGRNRETNIQNKCRKAASQCGATLFRNTVGAAKMANGSYIVYGLGTGTSDLIGFVPVTVTQQMVGKKIAVFAAIEVKTPNKKPNEAQERFIKFINGEGGIAGYVTSDVELLQLISNAVRALSKFRDGGE